jgi:integrase
LDIISGLLTAAVEEYEILANNPLLRVRKPKASHGRERFLSQEECARVLTACQHSRSAALYPLVVLAIATGCRKNELRTLRWRDVDLVRGALRLARTKNGERRAVPLASVALEVLRAWHGRSEGTAVWVFPSKDGHRPGNVSKAWYTARCKAGLPDFRFHDLRHTAASYLAMSGASLVEVAHILGHKTLRMVQRYSHFTDEHTRRTVEHMSHQFLPPPETQPDSDV